LSVLLLHDIIRLRCGFFNFSASLQRLQDEEKSGTDCQLASSMKTLMLSNNGLASRTLTFILAGGQGQRLHPLTRDRAKPAIPFGGIYRLIDFTLSNCLNSGFRRINILTQYQCESLHSHVRPLALRIPPGNNHDEVLVCRCPVSGKRYRGTADAVFQNLPILENSRADFSLILSGDHVYKMDYRELLRFHVDHGADVTIAGVEYPSNAASQFGILDIDPKGRLVGFEEKPRKPKPMCANSSNSLVSMGVYVFNTRALMDVLWDDAERNTSHDFGKDIIPTQIADQKVRVYNFTEMGIRHGSYWRDVGTVDAYFHVNMELLLTSFFDSHASASWPLYALDGHSDLECGEVRRDSESSVVDSVVPQTVSIGRKTRVIHSVLSSSIQIGSSAEVRNSILLQNVRIGAGARIQRAILDENVRIEGGVEIGYDSNRDRDYGFVTESGIVVIPANTYVGPQRFSPPHAAWRTELIGNRTDQVRVKSRTEE
jgi:glucose-1-phosphate adenylyltransferase